MLEVLKSALKKQRRSYSASGPAEYFVDLFSRELSLSPLYPTRISRDMSAPLDSPCIHLCERGKNYNSKDVVIHYSPELSEESDFQCVPLIEYRGELFNWVRDWMAFKGRVVREDLIGVFLEDAPRDLWSLESEMRKLWEYPGEIDHTAVRQLSSRQREHKLHNFLTALSSKNSDTALESLSHIRSQFSDEELVVHISKLLANLLCIKSMPAKSSLDLSGILGVPPNVVQRMKSFLPVFSEAELTVSLERVASASYQGCSGPKLDNLVLTICR